MDTSWILASTQTECYRLEYMPSYQHTVTKRKQQTVTKGQSELEEFKQSSNDCRHEGQDGEGGGVNNNMCPAETPCSTAPWD